MTNQLKNVLWMAEELDFAPLKENHQNELLNLTEHFLDMVAARGLTHCLYPAQ